MVRVLTLGQTVGATREAITETKRTDLELTLGMTSDSTPDSGKTENSMERASI